MESSQYNQLAQQLSQSTTGNIKQIKGTVMNEKLKSVKDFFQDQAELLVGKQVEESLDKLQKAGGVLKSLGMKAKEAGARVKSVGENFAEEARARVQARLSGTQDEAARAARAQISGEQPVASEAAAQTTEESIARGGGSVLGEDRPVEGTKRDVKDKDEDESKFERDVKDATKGAEEEDVADPALEEATLPLTAILGGLSLVASMFTKDHHQEVVQKAQRATSSAVQVGI